MPKTHPVDLAEVASRPSWLKVRFVDGPNFRELKEIMRTLDLHTVCEEARCPNIGECWEQRTATFLILGRVCTRRCAYCAIETGRPTGVDWAEPERVARAVLRMGLKHVVITSVTRDDLPDGGAAIFAATIRRIRRYLPDCGVEVLIPDFAGSRPALETVLAARPDILNHNIETVRRLHPRLRPRTGYDRALQVLRWAREIGGPDLVTKSGLMVGLGETWEEILQTMDDLRAVDCDILTIGQYLRPTGEARHVPIARYYTPEEFQRLKELGEARGFKHVEAGPLVRSSYHARQQLAGLRPGPGPA
jgi:lipoic acid synthetase